MNWGLIGGGKGSQIGEPHRIAARIDGLFVLKAGALDVDPKAGRDFAATLGIEPSRSYGDWRQMLSAEKEKPRGERLDLVTVATPNNTHFEITKAFLQDGFNVLCEKPLTMTVTEAEELVRVADKSGNVCAVNFGYSGYPMAIQAREMIRRGDLGDIRVVVGEFSHGFHAGGDDVDNPRLRWRYDPAQAGVSAIVADVGVHVFQMAEFMTGQKITSLSAQMDHCVASRQLEDDAQIAARFDGNAIGRFWLSAVATGQQHGFNIRVFGSKGGIRWWQEQPNQMWFGPLNGPAQTLERGSASLYPEALDASRISQGHAEGMLIAFANVYRGIHRKISGGAGLFPTVQDGAAMVRAVHAAVASGAQRGKWVDV